jgi:hypothetical protein
VEYEESCRGWFQAASWFSLMCWRAPCLSGLRVSQKQKEHNAANAKLAKGQGSLLITSNLTEILK